MGTVYQPQNVSVTSSYPTQEINWRTTPQEGFDFLLGSRWETVSDLKHIANSAMGDLRNRTWQLNCTQFDIGVLSAINGIQLDINTNRNGRITDEIIQLTYQGQLIGLNKFNYVTDFAGNITILNSSTYGGPTDLWGYDALTPEIVSDSTFGVALKFQAHPYYPHSSSMFLDSVNLTIY